MPTTRFVASPRLAFRPAALVAVAGTLALSAGVLAQSAPAVEKPASTSPAPAAVPEPSPLAGPKVPKPAAKNTLVDRDMTGKLVRIETRPEQAALELLGLSPAEREPAEKVLTERITVVSKLLKDNLELFVKIQAARQGRATREEIAPLMREFRPIAATILEKPLADQVAAALPEAKRADFRRLVTEYTATLVADEAASAPAGAPAEGPNGRPLPADAGAKRMEMNLLLREMGRSLKATTDEGRARTEELVRAVDATPEQEAQIQAILRDSKYPNALNRTPEQRAEIHRRVLDVLTPEQRRKAIELQRPGMTPPRP